jgi:hypothetical protein
MEILSKNVAKLQSIKGISDRQMSKLATEKGGVLHQQTVGNVKHMKSEFRASSLDGLALALDVEPYILLNPHGFDEQGKPVGENLAFPTFANEYAIDIVFNFGHHTKIEDREWYKNTVKKIAIICALDGKEAAREALLAPLIEP